MIEEELGKVCPSILILHKNLTNMCNFPEFGQKKNLIVQSIPSLVLKIHRTFLTLF